MFDILLVLAASTILSLNYSGVARFWLQLRVGGFHVPRYLGLVETAEAFFLATRSSLTAEQQCGDTLAQLTVVSDFPLT